MSMGLSPSLFAAADKPCKVFAIFSILGDMVREIGGEYVALTTLVGPNGDVHSFEPSPQNAKALAQAEVRVLHGLGFVGWLARLTQAAGFRGRKVLASQGVHLRPLDAGAGGGGAGPSAGRHRK